VIASTNDVRREMTDQTVEDGDLQSLYRTLRKVETRFVREVGFGFVPQRRTLTLYTPYADGRVSGDGATLLLRTPLLAAETVTNGANGVVETAHYRLESHDVLGSTPFNAITLTAGTWAWDGDTPVIIEGVWGYHAAYDEAWLPSGDVVKTSLAESASELAVTDADGLDAWGETPRFCPGQLLQIESAQSAAEWLEVVAVDTDTNTLTVRRGVNGSVAVTHEAGAIHIWQADEEAVRAVARWTGLLFSRRGAYEKVSFDGLAQVQFPTDLPDEAAAIARYFRSLFETPFEAV
jgi:hypothetical protein